MENNKNDFDDIILEKSNKSEKIKKILLRVIALIILFLIIMIVMKLINSGSDNKNPTVLPNEPTSATQQDNNTDSSFENMPIATDNSAEDQFEALRKQIQGDQNDSSLETSALDQNLDNANFASSNQDSIQDLNSNNLDEKKQTVANTTVKTEEKPKEQVKEQVKEQPKKTATKDNTVKKQEHTVKQNHQQSTNDLFKNVDAKPVNPDGLPSGIYVQIFSVNNLDQKSKELAAVRKKGYEYKLYKTTVAGKEITKVLIGPFSKSNISQELAKIRKEVAKDAFSFTLK
ncbi:SPOR domain-containing protein [Campylobacter sp. RM10532]|uniref:SPOR domain-containing protein n=1 Tax=Campylobacter molothri TaxID=1032242 RepID=UPI00301CB156|nr:SPOR domain-containing protein [Campylobacter sp. RM10543]MBZ7934279.1 SPOR domain-containing protein [Campylobacter sp. W0065]MBZ7939951.1 SPOR domain-containing protein [Campylobacter sp. W0047]MBZ7945100.1 SPOR domain-containing protein [Campylobacter sp. RM10532]MBZ7950010.1 SPOR domain-containing protein [Campylobacter sp. RM10534]